jgi:hypothetical protein
VGGNGFDGPLDVVDSRMHHLIVLLSKDSRKGARGWGRVSSKVRVHG